MAYGRGESETINQAPFYRPAILGVDQRTFSATMVAPLIMFALCILFRLWLFAILDVGFIVLLAAYLINFCNRRNDPQAVENHFHARGLSPKLLSAAHTRGKF